jgi:pyrimidine deaminase RibD-like protein
LGREIATDNPDEPLGCVIVDGTEIVAEKTPEERDQPVREAVEAR